MYYYGYKANSNGEALWLMSATGPKTIKKDETYTLDMLPGFIGNGGSLTMKPTAANSGVQKWGSADITFFDCNNGEITLSKSDGTTVTQNIILLAGVDGMTCE
ncbi:hypothetical protein [Marinicella gelatinilytica]|uniref:hypothetical protein n=1 Tax=Marinicella gelatinilytica TaxID=2996017 RepID=UPI0022609AB6|nr:hypothetical protein [Marinicella gelatinilytica]MCX7544363.1 hypothetical protein [Marinicella gelatinilytica]